jgi:hypothetical protein
MRVARLITIAITLTLTFSVSRQNTVQAVTQDTQKPAVDWTPKPQDIDRSHFANGSSALRGVTVVMIMLGPDEARQHYNIKLSSPQHFVVVRGIANDSPAYGVLSHDMSGREDYGSIQADDLIDTIIVGGEVPKHGQVKTIADFDRVVSLCVRGCLVFVRHKDFGSMSDITKQGELFPRLFSFDGKHLCDKKTQYVYNVRFDPRTGFQSENWSGPQHYSSFCLASSVPPDERESPTENSSDQPLDTTEREIAAIRNAPHTAMPAAQAFQEPLGGQTKLAIKNGTAYTLTLYLSGPASHKLQIAAGGAQTLRLPPGHYEIAAKVSKSSVIPFYGTGDYSPDTGYSSHFYIAAHPR